MSDVKLEFHKSSYSGNRQDCVEVARNPVVGAAVQDTKNREAGYLAFPAAEWKAFLDEVRAGDL